ncbi:MAG: FecCD family ABC transporter permease [Lachnospiraceae bacterium]
MEHRVTFSMVLVLLTALLGLSILLAVTFGSVKIPVSQVYQVIAYKLFKAGSADILQSSVYNIVWGIRLPRLILAVGVGISLSVSGCIMQAVVKNPIADPYILGISSGAYTGATLALLLGLGSALGSGFVGAMAFLGAFAMSLLVIGLANIGGKANSVKLILCGTAISSVCSAVANFIIYMTNESNKVQAVINWTMGSLASAEAGTNAVVLCVALLGTCFFLTQYRSLNLMLMGDEMAVTLGTSLHSRRILYLLVSAFMVGFAVYAAGMIGFVGLLIPHIARMCFGSSHKRLLPVAALFGAIFLVWADVLCRILIAKTELPIGILTALVGSPCFIYLMLRKKYAFGGGA